VQIQLAGPGANQPEFQLVPQGGWDSRLWVPKIPSISSHQAIFVNETAELVRPSEMSQISIGDPERHRSRGQRSGLVRRPVRTVAVAVLDELLAHCFRAGPVEYQHPVEACPANGGHESLGEDVGG
jgi:hypothetical protein